MRAKIWKKNLWKIYENFIFQGVTNCYLGVASNMYLHKVTTSINSDTAKFLTNAHKIGLLRTPVLSKFQ